MTVETDVLALTAKITALNSRVTGRKDKLAAAVDTATDAVTLSATAEAGTLANRDELEDMRTLAYGYSTAAGSATPVADLTAIAQSKAVTAVDVFVYDTTKDSDGGAWRKRCQHTSWYRETLDTATRGSRREFPAVAVIVVEASKVTIYDGDDPTLPMWMVFSAITTGAMLHANDAQCVFMLNGVLAVGKEVQGLRTVYFLKDRGFGYKSTGSYRGSSGATIAERNDSFSIWDDTNSSYSIVNSYVNDVAMTVLPNAPVDPATGLPIPTIAVATNGGVSVITDSGAVYDGGTTFTFSSVGFDESNNLYACRSVANFRVLAATPSDYTSGDAFGLYLLSNILATQYGGTNLRTLPEGFAWCFGGTNATGISIHLPDLSTSNANALRSQITSDYNTGWMPGDIKLATLSDTTPGTIAGQDELVTNGTFDTGVDGWSVVLASGTPTVSYDNGRLKIVGDGVSTWQGVYTTFTAEVGKAYRVLVDIENQAGNINAMYFRASAGTNPNIHSGDFFNIIASVGQSVTASTKTFVATNATMHLHLMVNGADTGFLDNVSLKEVVADRSVNNSALQAYGNIVKSPVATGAQLMAYSGFNTSNYLYQPYNSDLDFGTGDFCMMGWVNKTVNSGADAYITRSDLPNSNGGWLFGDSAGNLAFWRAATNSYNGIYSGYIIPLNTWTYVSAVRVSGVLYLYANGRLVHSQGYTNDVSFGSEAELRVGIWEDQTTGLQGAVAGSLALIRISATAPSAEQIKKIYEDEKVLFQEGAQATLYGSSNAVTALAYDDVKEQLHVGTSAGRSVFEGLRRVTNTTTAVGKAISAVDGLVVEE